jgi:hypothetical protein
MDPRRIAPFTPDEVASLDAFQRSGVWNPFTCRDEACRRELVATEAGWNCPACPYTQDWAYTWMADWTWRRPEEILKLEG